jgi:hypothetical protein
MRRLAQNFLVLFITLLITMGIIDMALRWFYPVDYRPPASELPNVAQDIIYQASAIPGLDYELVPGISVIAHGAQVTTNSFGMRGDEPDPQKNRRLVVTGDSFTFGFNVAQEKIFPHLLKQSLQAKDPNYEVLNLAVSGYATKDEVITLREKGMKWQPEVIIVGYVMNDPEVEPIQEIPAYFRQPDWWQHSHVLRLFARGAKRLEILVKGGGDYYRYLHADQTSWASVVDGFAAIKEMADSGEAKVMVVLFPDLWHDWANYPYRDIEQQVSDLARADGFTVINLRDYFSAYPPDQLRVSPTDGLPNALAHQLAAQSILDYLSP